MIANTKRGETTLMVDGKAHNLCLTLGALAKIESAFALSGIGEIDKKFQNLSAQDVILLLAILLEGGGNPIEIENIKSAKIDTKQAINAILECFSLNFGVQ